MSDVVSSEELNTLAAEFVLGTLDYEERKGAAALLEVDHAFRGIVRIWERRLGELHLMVEAVEPDPQLWARIRPKIGDIEQVELAIPSHTAEHPTEGEATATAFAPSAVSAEPSSDVLPVEAPENAPLALASPEEERPVEAAPAAPGDEAAVEPAAPVAQETMASATMASATKASETPQAVADAELRLAELAALLPPSGQESQPEPGSPPLEAPMSEPAPSEPPASEAVEEPREPEQVSHGFVPPPPMVTRSVPAAVETVRRTGRGWIAATLLMGLVAIGLAGLIGAWRYFPERLPEPLRIHSLLNLPEPPPPVPERPPPPPFDE